VIKKAESVDQSRIYEVFTRCNHMTQCH